MPRQENTLLPEPKPFGFHSARSKKPRAFLVIAWKSAMGISRIACPSMIRFPFSSRSVQALAAMPARKSPVNAGDTSVRPFIRI